MTDHDSAAYGERIAGEYDELIEGMFDTDATVARLAALAGDGPVLELGIGTGRLAIPLARLGLTVHGIDGSRAMVERLQAKPGGEEIRVTVGDFSEAQAPGTFSLVVLAVNTIFALPDQEAQVRCFQNAARHLLPGGRFVVEAWVPDPGRFVGGSAIWARRTGGTHVSFDLARIDPVEQHMATTQVSLRDGEVRLYPANHRYAWPAELDLMARIAGLRREHRWADWDGSPFVATSTAHVTVYRGP